MLDLGEGEEEDFGIDLPESLLTDKGFRPARREPNICISTNTRILAGNQTHTLELLEGVFALENAVTFDFDAPFSLGSPTLGCKRGSFG